MSADYIANIYQNFRLISISVVIHKTPQSSNKNTKSSLFNSMFEILCNRPLMQFMNRRDQNLIVASRPTSDRIEDSKTINFREKPQPHVFSARFFFCFVSISAVAIVFGCQALRRRARLANYDERFSSPVKLQVLGRRIYVAEQTQSRQKLIGATQGGQDGADSVFNNRLFFRQRRGRKDVVFFVFCIVPGSTQGAAGGEKPDRSKTVRCGGCLNGFRNPVLPRLLACFV